MTRRMVTFCGFCGQAHLGEPIPLGTYKAPLPPGWKEIVNPDNTLDHFCKDCLEASDVLKVQRIRARKAAEAPKVKK